MPQNPTIARFLLSFLPFSETFIYSYIKNIRNFNQIIVASKRENEDQFTYDPSKVFTFDEAIPSMVNLPIPLKHRMLLTKKNRFFYNVLKENDVKLVHAHFGYVGVAALAVAKRLNIPLITTFHGLDMSKLGRDLYYRIMYRRMFYYGKAFVVEGSCMRKKLIELGCPKDKAKIIHLGVDIKKFELIQRRVNPGERIKFLMCSRFVEKKGIPYGIKAFAKALKSYDNMELNIIGGESSEYQTLIEKLGAKDKIKILGKKKHAEVASLMRGSHVFMAPSITARDGDTEGGTPTTVLEAEASGLPLISTFHADIPEAVVDKKTGFLSPEKDFGAMSANILKIVQTPDLLAKMGTEGRRHIEKEYDSTKVTAKLEELYGQVLSQEACG
jgi:colanic acid/amylovoran biosynthesis glycosyltransferase